MEYAPRIWWLTHEPNAVVCSAPPVIEFAKQSDAFKSAGRFCFKADLGYAPGGWLASGSLHLGGGTGATGEP